MSYVFITGASSGLGEAVANQVSKKYNLILNGRDDGRLRSVGEQCAKNGTKILLFPYDLSNVDCLASTFGNFIKEHDIKVHAFVHFAGITEVLPISKTKYKVSLEVMNVNYFSATEIISTLLKKRINGDCLENIILISSIAATIGARFQSHYCASKGAISALTIALARDLAPKVRVNALSPGSFPTRMWNTPLNEEGNFPKKVALLSAGNTYDVANVVDFLLSEQATYLTGINIPIDGGERFNF